VKTPRLSIASLMVLVLIVAANLGAARVLFSYNEEMLIGIAPSAIAFQIALIVMLRGQGGRRAFWCGFLVCGLLATATFVWAMSFPEVIGISFRNGSMTLYKTPGSPLYTIWHGYTDFVVKRLVEPIILDPRINPGANRDSLVGGLFIGGIRSVIWSLPQLLLAVIGGFAAVLTVGWRNRASAGRSHVAATAILPAANG